MQTIRLLGAAALVSLLAACGSPPSQDAASVEAAPSVINAAYPDVQIGPTFTEDGKLVLPENFREWVFLGSPLTPNGLNGGAAGFPEYHNVYVEPAAFAHYRRTGSWPEGTMMVKELQLVATPENPDGSRAEPSGRGYFPAATNGMDVSVKDSKRFADTNNWGFFNFGHHAPPYEAVAAAAPAETCASCHIANAHEDMTFINFYKPILTPLPAPVSAQ